MNFNYTIGLLNNKIKELYELGENLLSGKFDNYVASRRIVEIEMAIRMLKKYVFKVKE